MKKYKEITINMKEKTEEYIKLEKLVKENKITKEEMIKIMQRNYRVKGVPYEKYYQ